MKCIFIKNEIISFMILKNPEYLLKNKGQSLAEWSLIIALISIVGIAALTTWGQHLNTTTQKINNALNSVNVDIDTMPPP